MFKALGNAVMHGRAPAPAPTYGAPGGPNNASAIAIERAAMESELARLGYIPFTPTYDEDKQWIANRAAALRPSIPRPPQPPQLAAAPQINPAIRAAAQADIKEGKEAAEVRAPHKGTRKAYISSTGGFPDKKELLRMINEIESKIRRDNRASHVYSPEELEKVVNREKFSLLKQYSLSKHEPMDVEKYGPNYADKFGDPSFRGAASKFIGGEPPGIKGWRNMSPAEKDEFMAKDFARNNAPERLVEKQARELEAKNRQYVQQERRQIENENKEYAEQARQQAARWAALSPSEKQQITYNQQLADYNEEVERNQYMNMMPQQYPQQFGQQMGGPEMSPVMLNDLAQMIQGEQTRYVPMRPKRSIHDRVMSSFDPNMFSPEFIPEE